MKDFIKSNKFLLAIAGVIAVILITIIIMALTKRNQPAVPLNPQSGRNPSAQSNSNANVSSGATKPNQGFKLFSWLFPSHTSSGQSRQSTAPSSSTQANQTVTQATGQNATSTTQGGSNANGSSGTVSQTTTSTSSNTSTAVNPNATRFQIVFNGPGGQTTYVPPVVPPTQINWAIYNDSIYHYSIQYPANWQSVDGQTKFAKGIILFPPGENTTDPSQKYIAFGWSNYNIYPTNSINNGGSVATPAKVTGVNGTIYTLGSLGLSYIISVFPYEQGYFSLITYSSDPTITYVYQHMLSSLIFYQ